MKPLISVLVPSYNYERYVLRAVESALGQTYPHIEVVVTDDRSTDGAAALIARRFGSDPRVRLSVNDHNLGVVGNFNRALEQARGEFVHWLPADDWMLPEHLDRLHRVFEREPALDVVYARVYFADDEGRVHSVKTQANMLPCDYGDVRDELPHLLGGLPPLSISAALWRRALFDELGRLDESIPILFDWELAVRAAVAGKRFGFCNDPSACVRLHPASASGLAFNESGETAVQALRIVERHLKETTLARLGGRENALVERLDHLYRVDRERIAASGVAPHFEADFLAVRTRLLRAAEVYEPARVREQLISVVVPAIGPFEATLAAIDSVAAQSFDAWQIVLIDQGLFPIRELLRDHRAWDRIAYVRLPFPRAPGAARNLGVDVARGEYIAFLDDDNRFAPDHLITLAQTVERGGAEVAVAGSRLVVERPDERLAVFEAARALDGVFRGPDDPAELGAVANALPLNAILHHRRFFGHAGAFNEQALLLEDFDYLMRLQSVARFAFSGATTLEVRVRLNLQLQALGNYAHVYLGALDALYAARLVGDGKIEEMRVRHRKNVAAAIERLRELCRTPDGVVEAVGALSGRDLFASRVIPGR